MAAEHIRCWLLILASVITTAAAARRGAPLAVDWKPAEATGTNTPDGLTHLRVSHRPTDAPRLASWQDLRRGVEVGTNTCGFFTDEGSPMICKRGYTCTNIDSYRDCCVGDDCTTSTFATACVDYDDPTCSNPADGTECCASTDGRPYYCITYLWSTTATTSKTFTLFNCEARKFSNDPQVLLAEPLNSTSSSDPTTVRPANSVSPSTTTKTVVGSSSSAPPTDAAANAYSEGGSSGAPVGAIVGGVVGGLAVIGLVVLGIFYMVIRNRRANSSGPAGGAGEPEGGPGGAGGPGQTGSAMSSSNAQLLGSGLSSSSGGPSPSSATLVGSNGLRSPEDLQRLGVLIPPGRPREKMSPVELVTTPTYSELPTQDNKAELPA